MQGFTDFVYRKNLAEVFGGVDKYFCPYISYGKYQQIRNSQLKDILPENNIGMNVVPQVLFSDITEFRELCKLLIDYGYSEINLNLGCPYPMATNRGRGSAILQNPRFLSKILKIAFDEFDVKISVKHRSGLESESEILSIIDVINQFPVSEVIYHPRIARQMYKGDVNVELFQNVSAMCVHPMVFNGDILSEKEIQKVKNLVPDQLVWMIGRGILQNPFLQLSIKGEEIERNLKNEKLLLFHEKMITDYANKLEGSGHLLQKMEQFWEYFSASFSNQHKVFKLIKKAGSIEKYNKAVQQIFDDYCD